jgi:hypothetical protein
MLLGNRSVFHKLPIRFLAGTAFQAQNVCRFNQPGMRRNRFYQGGATTALKTYSLPAGTYAPSGAQKAGSAYVLPQRAGAIASYNDAVVGISLSGLAYGGITTDGNIIFSIVTNTPEGQLISSGSGSASFVIDSNTPLLTASLNGAGTALFTISNGATNLTALGFGTGSSNFAITALVTPGAIGSMSGTTVDNTTLTTASLIAAMNASPPNVNIKKVNDVTVTGTGAPGDTWGP